MNTVTMNRLALILGLILLLSCAMISHHLTDKSTWTFVTLGGLLLFGGITKAFVGTKQ